MYLLSETTTEEKAKKILLLPSLKITRFFCPIGRGRSYKFSSCSRLFAVSFWDTMHAHAICTVKKMIMQVKVHISYQNLKYSIELSEVFKQCMVVTMYFVTVCGCKF